VTRPVLIAATGLGFATRRRRINGGEVYQDGEGYRRLFDALDDPHGDEADDLNGREHMDSKYLDMSQVDVVRLILDRHQHYQYTIVELHAQTAEVYREVKSWSHKSKVKPVDLHSALKTTLISTVPRYGTGDSHSYLPPPTF